MPRFATGVIIGTVALKDAGNRDVRAEIDGGAGFRSTYATQTEHASDGTPFQQRFTLAMQGRSFSLKVAQLPMSVLDLAIAEVEAAKAALGTVRVRASSITAKDIDVQAFASDEWLETGPYSGDPGLEFVKDVTFRFESVAAGA
jgi:hypothetical protein